LVQIWPKISIMVTEISRITSLQPTTSSFNFQTVSESNVYRLLLSLNPRKSTGIDKIPAKFIRIAAPVITNSLTKIFNVAIISATVLFEWKITRNDPRNLLNNYRPISILPFVSKLYYTNNSMSILLHRSCCPLVNLVLGSFFLQPLLF
jgi:hypothetical protein